MNHYRRRLLKAVGLSAAAIPLSSCVSWTQPPPRYTRRKLGLAIVGLGNYATHQVGVGLEKSDFWNVAGIVTGSPSKIPGWKKKWGLKDENIFNYNNFDSIVKRADIDVVYICLPNSMHAEFTIRAAKAGKHVICEKPMAVTVQEAEQMIQACDQAGVKLAIGYRLHFNLFHKQVMEWGANQTHGKVDYVNAIFTINVGDPDQWRLKKKMSGGGALMDVGIYCVQAARYATAEEPVSVTAQFGPITDAAKFREVEESISWQMNFPSGAYMTGYSGFKNYVDELYVGAAKKSYKIEPAFSYGPLAGEVRGEADGKMNFPYLHHQRMQMEGMGPLFLDNAPMPDAISGIGGLKDMKILEAIYDAANSGSKILL